MNRFRTTMTARRSLFGMVILITATMFCLGNAGCSRPFWRKQADFDSYDAIQEKTADARWWVPRISVDPDPRSRFYDPYDPDCEPLPPDDPAAHEYMHWVDGKCGYKSWHDFGTALSIENPHWLEAFGLTNEMLDGIESGEIEPVVGLYNMTLEDAIELANIHSRDYQTEVETVFLAALALTFERFQFGVRYLPEPTFDLNQFSSTSGKGSMSASSGVGASQLLPAGGQWTVELLNNTLWFFTGDHRTTSASILSYSLVQPLLLGGGRKFVLEALTQAERNLLYAVRDLARFRMVFFTDTVADYLTLLRLQQNVVNQQGNILRLEEQTEIQKALADERPQEISEGLEQLPPELDPEQLSAEQKAQLSEEQQLSGIIKPDGMPLRYNDQTSALYWRGPMSPEDLAAVLRLSDDPAFQQAVNDISRRLGSEVTTLNVAQLETDLVSSRNTLRDQEVAFQNALDTYKLFVLGLPPDLPISIDLSMLGPFELIDPRLSIVEQRVKEFVIVWAQLNEDNPDEMQLAEVIDGLVELDERIRFDGIQLVDEDFARVASILQQGLGKRFQTEAQILRARRDYDNDQRLYSELRNDLDEVSNSIQRIRSQVQMGGLTFDQRIFIFVEIANLREELLKISQGLQVIQIGLRVELIILEPFTMKSWESVEQGLNNRRDLKNARAQVMDARRLLEVRANQLEAVLDVIIEGDIGSLGAGAESSHFQLNRSSMRAGVEFTAPLDQISERNAYRTAQVAYQRARRTYMLVEDQIKRDIRRDWRQLDVTRQNFENNRVNIRLAALQYDNAVEAAAAPVEGTTARGSSSALDLLNALRSVLQASNSLIGDWVTYEQNRLNIYLNMGIMEIDSQGIWVDDYYQSRAASANEAEQDGNRTRESDSVGESDFGGEFVQP